MYSDPFIVKLHEWIELFMRRSMGNFICHARKCGLSMSHLGAMFHIHFKGSSGVTELGDHLGVTSAASSQMLDRLVQQDLILRTEDPNDRRVRQIVLTNKGQRILRESILARESWLDELAEALSDEEKETITDALNILIDRMKNIKQPIGVEN
jgi:DNA-binding MarR family transcriptional regulator